MNGFELFTMNHNRIIFSQNHLKCMAKLRKICPLYLKTFQVYVIQNAKLTKDKDVILFLSFDKACLNNNLSFFL